MEARVADSHREQYGKELPEVRQRDPVQAQRMRVARAVDRLPGRRRDREHVPEHLRRREERLGKLEEHMRDVITSVSYARPGW
jgi:hypothetical protein